MVEEGDDCQVVTFDLANQEATYQFWYDFRLKSEMKTKVATMDIGFLFFDLENKGRNLVLVLPFTDRWRNWSFFEPTQQIAPF
ncbi:hypothetical protein L1987_85719 [Smallanthus sonchifolius]|uniref:Uncharacterized protein n=1 Tax=Smallanthus sonchifolius TaxID=185202 RepID=A0ACB8XYI6_9ASTR|nr:hypothetical protein L1987_85719 [Smallanthus sonchifolius]